MNCPYCKGGNTYMFFNALMPTIVSACQNEILKNCTVEEIELTLCNDCLLGFNSKPLGDNKLKYIYDNYLYISPSNGIGVSKYSGMVSTLSKYVDPSWKVVEIGCSEGYVLEQLRSEGFTNLVGIEPGPQADEARARGLNVRKDYFTSTTFAGAEKIDAFYMMHVFEHFPDPFSIFKSMVAALTERGVIVIEVPDFCGVQHQHLYYYNIVFFQRLANDFNLKIIDFESKNGDLRVVLARLSNDGIPSALIVAGKKDVLLRAKSFENMLTVHREAIAEFMSKARRENKRIYWWGAGSASVICINELKRSIEFPEFTVVDGYKAKWGLMMPGVNKEVEPFTVISNSTIDYLVIASSFHEEIKSTMKQHNIIAKSVCVIAVV